MYQRLISRLAAIILSASAGLTAGATTASAQGLFGFLFGGGGNNAYPQQAAPNQSITTPGGRPYQFPSTTPSRKSGDGDDHISNYGAYKTICVRMCDGYYFPISTSTTRRGFPRDEARCQASCGNEGRLYHVPANQSAIDDAVDNEGRSYAATRTAFLYRKKKVDGCQCRPAPWTETELNRHRIYAEAEEAGKARQSPEADKAKIAAMTNKADPKPAETTGAASTSNEVTVAAVDEAPKQTSPEKSSAGTRPRNEKLAARTMQASAPAKPPQNYGPVPVKLPQQTAAQPQAAPYANPMGLGGSSLQWPGDAPPPQPYPRRR